MKLHKLSEFESGKNWFIGNFEPSLHKTEDFEIAYKAYIAGQKESAHFHALATEYNLITRGSARFHFSEWYKEDKYPDTLILYVGEIIIIEPGEVVEFEAFTDCEMVVIKIPGNGWKDKFLAS